MIMLETLLIHPYNQVFDKIHAALISSGKRIEA
jgi:hypothetical protein